MATFGSDVRQTIALTALMYKLQKHLGTVATTITRS